MKTVHGKPITGGKTQMRPAANVKTAQTSSQAERLIKRPPMPFQTKQGPAMMPTGSSSAAMKGVGNGASANTLVRGSKPTIAATGNKVPGGYSKVVGGQKGTSHPSRKTDTAANLGVKSKRNAAFYGGR